MCMFRGGGQQAAAQPLTAEQLAARNAATANANAAANLQRKTKPGPDGGTDFAETVDEFRARKKKLFGIEFNSRLDHSGSSEGAASGSGGGGGTGGCFVQGTLVLMADGSQKQIEFINIGDMVATFESFDLSFRAFRGEIHSGEVSSVFVARDRVVQVNNLTASEEQWMIDGSGTPRYVQDFKVGDSIMNAKGAGEIIKHYKSIGFRQVFNFDVEDTHTFIVDGLRTARSVIVEGYSKFTPSRRQTMQQALVDWKQENEWRDMRNQGLKKRMELRPF